MAYGTAKDESDPLLSTKNTTKPKNYSTSICINHIVLLILFALVISSSVYTLVKKQTQQEIKDLEVLFYLSD